MAAIQEYKCPCCGGAIAFDSTVQKMKCPYCETEFEMETLADYDKELKSERADDMSWETSAGNEWKDGETEGLRSACGHRPVDRFPQPLKAASPKSEKKSRHSLEKALIPPPSLHFQAFFAILFTINHKKRPPVLEISKKNNTFA